MNTIKQWLNKYQSPLSLRHYLLLPLLGMFFVLGLLMLTITYWGAQQSITQFSDRLSEQVAKTVSTRLERFFFSAVTVIKVNQEVFATGLFSLADKASLQQLFVTQVGNLPFVTFVSAVDHNGEYTGATRTPDTNDIQIMTAYLQDDRMLSLYKVGKDNVRGELIRQVRKSDQRSRPWYQQGLLTQKLGWYPIYKYLPYKGLGVGVVAPIFNRQSGAFDGVITVDLALDHISHYLRSIDVGSHGLTFLVDDKGKLAATSLAEPVYTAEVQTAEQLTLSNYPDERLRAVANIMQPQGQFNLHIDGRDYVLHKRVIQDDHGLYFVIGVLLATDDFAGSFYQQLLMIIMALFVVILLGLLMVRYLSYLVVKPIELLIERAKCLTDDQHNGQLCLVEHSQIAELNQLACVFNRSSDRINEGFRLLEQRVAERTAELAKANSQLEALSNTDGLTGIANRRYFDDRFTQMKLFSIRSQHPISVLMTDVDWFKLYNDRYGHLAGDECLKQVAHALQSKIRRQSDLLARYGGEEFVFVLYDTDGLAAQQVAQAMLAAVSDMALPHQDSQFGRVTISIGIATWQPQQQSSDIEQLLEQADLALYQAKKQGRNLFFGCISVLR